jgi:hypothetical protein
MNSPRPALFPSTDEKQAGWLVVSTIVFLVYSAFGVSAKVIIRARLRKLELYDLTVVAALLLAFAQSIVVIRACVNGLGQHRTELSSRALETIQKVFQEIVLLLHSNVSSGSVCCEFAIRGDTHIVQMLGHSFYYGNQSETRV